MYHNLFDSHAHSDNSFDGVHSVTFLCENAIQKGLVGIAVTDHCDIELDAQQHYKIRLEQSYFEVCKARMAFGREFVVASGVEIAEPDADPLLADEILKLEHFDFILGAVHSTLEGKDPYFCDFRKDDPYHELDSYFDRMDKLLEWNQFDSLAHLTYPLRYIYRDGRRDVDLTRYRDRIDYVLRHLVQHGKALEINTGGLRQELGQIMPTLDIVKRFKELGGEIITVGSDAHRVEDLGANIEDAFDLALEAGFKFFAFYKDREPRMMRIF